MQILTPSSAGGWWWCKIATVTVVFLLCSYLTSGANVSFVCETVSVDSSDGQQHRFSLFKRGNGRKVRRTASHEQQCINQTMYSGCRISYRHENDLFKVFGPEWAQLLEPWFRIQQNVGNVFFFLLNGDTDFLKLDIRVLNYPSFKVQSD